MALHVRCVPVRRRSAPAAPRAPQPQFRRWEEARGRSARRGMRERSRPRGRREAGGGTGGADASPRRERRGEPAAGCGHGPAMEEGEGRLLRPRSRSRAEAVGLRPRAQAGGVAVPRGLCQGTDGAEALGCRTQAASRAQPAPAAPRAPAQPVLCSPKREAGPLPGGLGVFFSCLAWRCGQSARGSICRLRGCFRECAFSLGILPYVLVSLLSRFVKY